jgi:RimJ/RimL family protein N-acetyltransferase
MPLPIATERLELRAYRPEDIPRIHTVLYGDADARRLTGGVSDLDETRATIERYIEFQHTPGYSFWAVLVRGTGELVGEAGLKPLDDIGPEIEIGYAFTPAVWGRGYATEAGRAIVAEAFGALGLDEIVGVTSEDNAGSRRVFAKLGFVESGRRHAYGEELLYYVLDRS